MTRATVFLISIVAMCQIVVAEINIHEFSIVERHRTQNLAQLLTDASKKYPELRRLKPVTLLEELKALYRVGENISAERKSMNSGVEELEKRVARLENKQNNDDYQAQLDELKKYMKKMQLRSADIRELTVLATRAYRLSKKYDPPHSLREDWINTWRSVKRLVPHHM